MMNIQNLSMNDRRKALWLGSIAGDAFVLGGHWIYDLEKLRKSFPDYSSPQAPLSDTYHKNKKLGDQTHYGDQARHLWQFLLESNGNYDPASYRKEWVRFITKYNGYMDGASRESLTALKNNLQYGSGSDELGGTARLAAVYYWIEDPALALTAATDQSMMTHDNRQATAITVLAAKAITILLSEADSQDQFSVFDALDKARIEMVAEDEYDMHLINDSFVRVNQMKDFSAESIAGSLGQSCHARHALPAILAVLKQPDDYQAAMRLNVMIGGDSASRAMIIGALLGARLGTEAIPAEWLEIMRD
jgi:ADP-ribosylglycohydrolase